MKISTRCGDVAGSMRAGDPTHICPSLGVTTTELGSQGEIAGRAESDRNHLASVE